MDKLAALNSIPVEDFSCCGDECEYVLVELNAGNIWALMDAGFTAEQIDKAMGDDRDFIDLSVLAFHYADAKWWSHGCGFMDRGPRTLLGGNRVE